MRTKKIHIIFNRFANFPEMSTENLCSESFETEKLELTLDIDDDNRMDC